MRTRLAAATVLGLCWPCALGAGGVVIDCIAVTVGRSVITRSAILEQARIAAFLNGEAIDLSEANLRRTAERLVDVTLIRREMEISRYTAAGEAEVEQVLTRLRSGRNEVKPEDFTRSLEAHGIDQADLRRYLALQTQTLRFVELRFRPGSSVSDAEVDTFFRDHFVPDFLRANPAKKTPALEDVRDRIEAILLEQRADQAMDQWLKETRAQTRVTYFPEGCPVAQAVAP